MSVKIIKEKISKQELEEIAKQEYDTMVKIAVDIKKEIIALGAEWHSECQEILVEHGSLAQDIWGANVLLNKSKQDRIKFNSLINIKPNFKHYEMEITNKEIKAKIKEIVDKLIA